MRPFFLVQYPSSKDMVRTVIEVVLQCPEKKDPIYYCCNFRVTVSMGTERSYGQF